MESKANDRQVGGSHYRDQVVQPWDAIIAWGLGFLDGSVVKYVARWKLKGGIEDLKKARHFLDKVIEVEEAKLKVELAKSPGTIMGPFDEVARETRGGKIFGGV